MDEKGIVVITDPNPIEQPVIYDPEKEMEWNPEEVDKDV
jgi:hypothetical protein